MALHVSPQKMHSIPCGENGMNGWAAPQWDIKNSIPFFFTSMAGCRNEPIGLDAIFVVLRGRSHKTNIRHVRKLVYSGEVTNSKYTPDHILYCGEIRVAYPI